MNFVVDAHLPRRLANHLRGAGHDALHTLDLPLGNRTPDQDIITLANQQQRVVITKDADFVNSFLLRREPAKLLLISTGNITNTALDALFIPAIPAIIHAFDTADYIELSNMALIVHI